MADSPIVDVAILATLLVAAAGFVVATRGCLGRADRETPQDRTAPAGAVTDDRRSG